MKKAIAEKGGILYFKEVKRNNLNLEKKKVLRRLKEVSQITSIYPTLDRDFTYHCLFLLEKKPVERIGFGIQRTGRIQTQF